MEILVLGRIPEEDRFIATCGNCTSQLRAQRSELTNWDSMYPGEPSYYGAPCPVCSDSVTTWVKEPPQAR
ncbi:ubiquitin-binding domain-containing protein [Pseudomonas phage EM]|uniref:Ubiquitin-binding domain-containing protein n=1 Tax=Pseudomonas phage EM TaxID=2936914 RepID=A0AAE9HLX5_9CAUD|nr:ubiquitin-binding domain-containing protein [Pseudomonas phage EM]UPW35907.1 ubiquitin-binding domain-containing protein [Pseudomonas phage EM]